MKLSNLIRGWAQPSLPIVLAILALGTSVPPVPKPPGSFTATTSIPECFNGSYRVFVTWTPSAGAQSYSIWRGVIGGDPSTVRMIGPLPATQLAFEDDGLLTTDRGAVYDYILSAVNPDGTTKSIAPPAFLPNVPCPQPLTAPVLSGDGSCVNGSAVAHLTWTATPGALSYTLIRDGLVRQTGLPATSLSFDDVVSTGFNNGNTASYAVTAVLGGSSLTSNTVRLFAFCSLPPPVLDATLSTCDGVTKSAVVHLSWSLPPFQTTPSDRTFVLRDGLQIGVVSVSARTFDDATAAAGHTYVYKVIIGDGQIASSSNVPITTCPVVPPVTAPLLTTSSECDGATPKAHLTWTTSSGASSYAILRGSSQIGTTASTTFDDTSVLPNQAYVYVVRAIGPGGSADSAPATHVVASCHQPSADLAVSGLTVSASTVMPGELLTINFSAANIGELYAPVTTTRLRMGIGPDPRRDDTLLTELFMPGQPAGTTKVVSVVAAVPATMPEGQFYVFVSADDDFATADLNRADNVVRSLPVHVTPSSCVLSCTATAPTDGVAQKPVSLQFLSALCPPYTINWDFGDGSSVSGSPAVTHTYSQPGVYHWTVKVFSGAGMCDTSGTINVAATDPPPPPKRRSVRH